MTLEVALKLMQTIIHRALQFCSCGRDTHKQTLIHTDADTDTDAGTETETETETDIHRYRHRHSKDTHTHTHTNLP